MLDRLTRLRAQIVYELNAMSRYVSLTYSHGTHFTCDTTTTFATHYDSDKQIGSITMDFVDQDDACAADNAHDSFRKEISSMYVLFRFSRWSMSWRLTLVLAESQCPRRQAT